MNSVQAFEIVAIASIAVSVAAGAGLFIVFRALRRYQRNQHVIMGSRGTVNIVDHVAAVDEKLTNVRVALEDLTLAARDHDVRIDSSLSRVGIVRFDAYQDLGGRQSTAVAFLNSLGDGVVITTVVSRDFARMYVKLLKEGAADVPLAPEETEALEQARGSSPFTIRPRVEGLPSEAGTEGETAATASDSPVSLGLPGRRPHDDREVARENRRRRRRRLPLIEDAVVPSAKGWEEPHTPAPAGHSLAERFLREHRSKQGRDAENDSQGTIEEKNGDDGEL